MSPTYKNILVDFIKLFFEDVEPILGSILKTDLAFSVDHTGIYVGEGEIVELNGSGKIIKVSYDMFINSSTIRSGVSISVACNKDGTPLGGSEIANRALSMVGKSRNYNFILNNCHQFTSGAITGNFENSDNLFTFLEMTIVTVLNYEQPIKWLIWDKNNNFK